MFDRERKSKTTGVLSFILIYEFSNLLIRFTRIGAKVVSHQLDISQILLYLQKSNVNSELFF